MAIIDALGRVLPVLLLFELGAVLRRRAFLSRSTVADLRRFVLAVTLPSALFLTFLRVSLELRYLPIVVIVFAACLGMLVAGPFLCRLVGVRSPFTGPLMTGFEAGMLGYAIYGGVFGQAALYRFGIIDLGQVLFVFFVLATVLTRRATGVTPGGGPPLVPSCGPRSSSRSWPAWPATPWGWARRWTRRRSRRPCCGRWGCWGPARRRSSPS